MIIIITIYFVVGILLAVLLDGYERGKGKIININNYLAYLIIVVAWPIIIVSNLGYCVGSRNK